MYRIGNSKEPTPEILRKVSHNLTEKTLQYSDVSVSCNSIMFADSQTPTLRYGIYIESFNSGTKFYDTWPEVLAKYREIMND